ncbi:MAG: hypothetical protein KGI72_05240 [Patescibacteria group bacterium]|nr:hypothetical protein [Patescibacteria group bacterium]
MTQKEFQKIYGGKIEEGWLVFRENLNCSNNRLTSLPENLKVGGNLYCYNNRLTSLPENLKVGGNLDCSNNQLTSLPENLKVGGNLDCSNNQLTSLPENLKVRGNLFVFRNVAWDDIKMVDRVLADDLSASEVFAIEDVEHRRVAYERMDKLKMRELPGLKTEDEVKDDGYGYPMRIISFKSDKYDTPFYFLNCFCPSEGREFFVETRETKCWRAKMASFGLNGGIKFDEEW